MRTLGRLCRVLSLVFCSVIGTSLLMYCAPGYFSDAREMDASHAAVVRSDLDQLRNQQASAASLLKSEAVGWLHGDLGQSRQFGTPVAELVRQRSWTSLRLLVLSVLAGWSAALLLAVPLSSVRSHSFDVVLASLTAILLALPVGVIAILCLTANFSAPVLVLALVIAVRDFKVLHRSFGTLWSAPFLLHARAQGLSTMQLLLGHMLPSVRRELLSLGVMSFTLALSALVPVEVVFDYPGLGQLAWSAAMNRDLPVLVAVTSLVALCVGCAGLAVSPEQEVGTTQCA